MRSTSAVLVWFIIITLGALSTPGCGSEERQLDERLFGVWTAHDRGRSYQLTFNDDGSFVTDMVRAVNGSHGEYWVRGGTTLVLEPDDSGQVSRLEGVLFLTPTTVVPRAMEPVGAHVGVIGYWSTRDGALSYEFRGDALVIRRELLGAGRTQSLISKGSWKQAGAGGPVEVTFADDALSGTLELFEDRVLGQAFHR